MPDKATVVRRFQKYILNPLARLVAGRRVGLGYAVLETTGRTTGASRRVPVGGGGLDGDTFWLVAEHGQRSDYVRNLAANPRVRVRLRGRWREGTATILPDDDPRQRLRTIGKRVNAAAVRAAGTDLLTIRVDLDPTPDAP